MPAIKPPLKENVYRKEKWGYYGELGEGANAKIRFLQTVISHEELDDITLISNIPGSEKWDVRDLFQRDVDDERVTKELLPYLQDSSQVKYFNPLTLIIIPMEEKGKTVLNEVEYLYPIDDKFEDIDYDCYEKSGYYKLRILKSNQTYAQIQWNDRKCYLVAIDGQHRLSALKRWKSAPSSPADLLNWKIPVVILNIFKVEPDASTANLLEIVRKTFMYINTKAEKVNRLREILMNDESINALCTQELIQYSHSNDCKQVAERDESILPLIFFDWRGETKLGKEVFGIAAIKSIEEIYNWFEYYLLGDDNEDIQKTELELEDLSPQLENFGTDKPLTHGDVKRIREQFRKTVLLGLSYFFQNFNPYKNYIRDCRNIEKEAIERSDLAQHAFMKLRFGSHQGSDDLIENINDEFENLAHKFSDLKGKTFDEILLRDIGMRGIIYAFGAGKTEIQDIIESSISWIDYAKIVTKPLNDIYKDGWFKSYDQLGDKQRKILTFLIYDESENIINYRLQDAQNALGALLTILLFYNLIDKTIEKTKIDADIFSGIYTNYSDGIQSTVMKGIKKSIRSDLRDKFKGTQKEFNEEVNKKAQKALEKRMKLLEEYFEV